MVLVEAAGAASAVAAVLGGGRVLVVGGHVKVELLAELVVVCGLENLGQCAMVRRVCCGFSGAVE